MARNWPRILRWLLAALAVKLVLLAITGWWLFTTESGLARAVAWLESLDSVTIRVHGASGRLIGPLHVDAIDIEQRRATIHVEGVDADVEPSELLAGRIAAEDLRVARASIRVHERTGPPRPTQFMTRWLTLAIDGAAVADLLIESPGGARVPIRDIAGSATITRGEIEFTDARGDAGSWAVAGASGRLLARDPIAIEATSAWSLTSTREVVGVGRAMGNLDRLLVQARIAKPGAGRADAEVTKLTGDLQWTGRLHIETLDLNQWTSPSPFGPLRADLEGRGNRYHYEAGGTVRGENLPPAGVPATGSASWREGVLTWHDVTLQPPGAGHVHMQGTMEFSGAPSYDLHFDWQDSRWPLVGEPIFHTPRGDFRMQGWREFDYQFDGRIEPVDLPGIAGTAAGRFTTAQMIVDRSDWQTLGGQLEVHGMLSRDVARAWTATGRARRLDPATIRDDLPGRLDFRFAASGRGLDADAQWTASIEGLSGQFRGQPARGGGTVRHREGSWQFEKVAVALGPARLALDGTFGAKTALDARLVADDLSAFLPELGGSVDGRLQMQASTINLSFIGHDLRWGNQRSMILSADAYIDREDRVDSWLRLRTSGMTLAGQSLTDTRLSMDGRLANHGVEFRMGAGDDAVELRGRGAWVNRGYTLDTTGITAQGPRIPAWRLEAPSRFAASADRADLQPACFVAGERRVCVDGRWQRDKDWAFSARTDDFPLEALQREVPGEPHFHGLLSVNARATGSAGSPWVADVRADIRNATLEYRSASGAERSIALGRTDIVLASTATRHDLTVRLADAAETELTADLTANRLPGVDIAELPVTGTVRGGTRQLGVLPLFFEDIDLASGALTADFRVAGHVGTPQLTGEVRLSRGALDFYQANLRLRELEALLTLQEAGLLLRANAKAGPGTLDLDGRLHWEERHLTGVLALKGERLLLVDVPEARVLASPDLRMAIDGSRIDVTGSVTIPEARIEPAKTADAVLVSTDERILLPEQEAADEQRFDVTTDVRLVLGDRVDLDAYGLSGRITGAVRSRSAPQGAAVASGELEVRNGKYRAYTRELDVERGRLLFGGGPVTDPGVDLRATRKLPGYTVGVLVRGKLRLPQLTLFSEPPLPQQQIASMLLVGQSLDSLQAQDRQELGNERANLMAQGGAFLAGPLGRQVGLDEVGVAQDSENRTAVVLGKFLSPRLFVSYGISLVDQINTLKLRYTIGDRWVLSAESGHESALDIEYRIEK